MTAAVFYLLGASAIASALLCITRKNPVSSALWLVSTMFALAGIYVLLHAQFIAVFQVLVYAGAVMVLFLFVIMLLNLGREASDVRGKPAWALAAAVMVILGAQFFAVWHYTPAQMASEQHSGAAVADPLAFFPNNALAAEAARPDDAFGALSASLFQNYLVPFEITSVLLLVAAIGAVVLAKRRI